MTEEIIIDGINVSECGFFHPKYKDTDCHIALAFSEEYEGCMKCENNPNCYFKQLKQAEQKLEKIKDYFYTYIELEPDHLKTDILNIIEGEKNV